MKVCIAWVSFRDYTGVCDNSESGWNPEQSCCRNDGAGFTFGWLIDIDID